MDERLTSEELRDCWPILSAGERFEAFQHMARADSDDFFLGIDAADQAEILAAMPEGERRLWLRLLAPDDAADVVQTVPGEQRASGERPVAFGPRDAMERGERRRQHDGTVWILKLHPGVGCAEGSAQTSELFEHGGRESVHGKQYPRWSSAFNATRAP